MRRVGIVVALLLAAGAAHAQETVRLRSGRTLTGIINVDPSFPEGFTIRLWSTDGEVFVLWSQVAELDVRRLRSAAAAGDPTGMALVAAVRVITAAREVVGAIVGEDATMIHIKTASSPTAVPVPKSAILRRDDVRIPESEVYAPSEMIARRAVGPMTYAKLVELADFARSLGEFARAREFYEQASQADPTKQEWIAAQLAALGRQAREDAAGRALAEIRTLQREMKYGAAVEAAETWSLQYADTQLGRDLKDLVAQLRKEKADYDANRDKILAARVPELWRSARAALWNKYADRRYRLAEARGLVERMDVDVPAQVAKSANCTVEEAERFWNARDQKPMQAAMGTGSWIYRGGQDGGMDYTGSGEDSGRGDPIDDFRRRFGGGQDPKPKDLGRPLQTSEEWWMSASHSARREWLQCYYGLMSGYVKKVKEESKDCSNCRGAGTLKATRGAKSITVICSRCHGAKQDAAVTYW